MATKRKDKDREPKDRGQVASTHGRPVADGDALRHALGREPEELRDLQETFGGEED